ncbi:MAG TPA: sigma-70 family RNA polymerase sigma factor [Ignavibacteriaceae bacterium]|nr:sigma-70 family RNA polymerase sigma factor [Ignavibacteriaceae bacterium]
MKTNIISDEELMLDFQQNDNVDSFTILVKRYKNPLMNFVHKFVGDYEVAADIVQDTMIRVFKRKDSFKPIGKFSTWIYTIAGNLAKTELQRKRKFGALSLDALSDDEDKPFQIEDNRYRPDVEVINKLTYEMIMEAIQKIPPIFREILILRDIQELSYEEISEITNIPNGTIKSRLNRGRSHLQSILIKMTKD